MKKLLCFLMCPFLLVQAQKKDLSITDLIHYSNLSYSQLSNAVAKRGFKIQTSEAGDVKTSIFIYKPGKEKIYKSIVRNNNIESSTTYQTTSEAEYNTLKSQLEQFGFLQIKDGKTKKLLEEYQKLNVVINVSIETKEEEKIYKFTTIVKPLPFAGEIVYAEDFFKLTTHEFIASVFGPQHVKREVFYFSEDEKANCSVIYPNTNAQVIIIWEDEINYRKPSMLLVGVQLNEEQRNLSEIKLNKWRSKQGVYLGMSLNDLVSLNKNHLDLYSWQTENPGYVVPGVEGNLNFKQLGLQLKCIDCNNISGAKSKILNTRYVVSDARRVYIDKMIIMP